MWPAGFARSLARISHTHGRRKGSTRRGTTAGTAWNAGLRPAQPAEGGRREGLPVPRWRRPGGNLSVRRAAYMGVADTVCRTCLRSVKADGKERPTTLGSWCRVPPARTRMIGSSAQPARKEMGGTYAGAASSSLVSRSRACRPEAGPVLPVGAPGRPCHCAFGYTPSDLLGGDVPRREPSRRLGSSPPRPCGPLCRPEAGPVLPVGAPSRPRHGAIGSTRSRAHPRCRRPVAAAFHGNRRELGVPHPHPVTSISARASRVTGIPVTRLRLLGVRCRP